MCCWFWGGLAWVWMHNQCEPLNIAPTETSVRLPWNQHTFMMCHWNNVEDFESLTEHVICGNSQYNYGLDFTFLDSYCLIRVLDLFIWFLLACYCWALQINLYWVSWEKNDIFLNHQFLHCAKLWGVSITGFGSTLDSTSQGPYWCIPLHPTLTLHSVGFQWLVCWWVLVHLDPSVNGFC